MDSFELNKIAAAVLFSLLLVLGVKNAAEIIYDTPAANPKAFVVEGVVAEGETAQAEAPAPEVPLPVLLAQADVAKGEKESKKCQACHNLQEGAGAKIGPDLYGIVGRKVASMPGFSYSAAMKAHGAKAPTWTFDELFHFIDNPRGYIDGTAMSFAGIKKPQQRADLVAYLNTLGSNLPLPKVEAAPAAAAPAAEAGPAAPAAH
ncbi:MAG: cytochrome c family protein [Parvibaculum sp.]